MNTRSNSGSVSVAAVISSFFVPYFKAFDNYIGDVIITARGKRYRVIANSVITIANEPAYIWAIGSEITVPKGDYYDDFA